MHIFIVLIFGLQITRLGVDQKRVRIDIGNPHLHTECPYPEIGFRDRLLRQSLIMLHGAIGKREHRLHEDLRFGTCLLHGEQHLAIDLRKTFARQHTRAARNAQRDHKDRRLFARGGFRQRQIAGFFVEMYAFHTIDRFKKHRPRRSRPYARFRDSAANGKMCRRGISEKRDTIQRIRTVCRYLQ